MSVTKIKFLGTAAAEGWPGLFCECDVCQKARDFGGKNIRTRCSLQIDDEYKVDLPPDNYLHVLRYNLNFAIVKHLFVTHTHYDHFHPDDLLMRREPFAHLRREEPLFVYGNKKVIRSIKSTMRAAPGLDLKPQLLKPFSPTEAGKFKVTPLEASHSEVENCLLFLFEADGKMIFHGYDTGWFPTETWHFLENHTLDMAILDCTSGDIPDMKYHMSVHYVIKAKERMLSRGIADKETTFVATHFSHTGGLLHEDLIAKLQPKNIRVAFDGLEIEL